MADGLNASLVKQLLLTDLTYCGWADQHLLNATSALTDEELRRDLGISHKSVLGTFQHVYDSERFWFECLEADVLPPLDQIGVPAPAAPPPDPDVLKSNWPSVWAGLRAWVAQIPAHAFASELACQLSDGMDIRFTRWQLLRHMTNHSAMHRGQIVGMLRMLAKQPPNTDLMTYLLLR
jgi:uncharacterized damage-inducible protein DinB